jgi:mono/diheme cytochrome c family protein
VISQILVGAVEHGMPPFADVLNDREVAAITTFVMNSFGNSFGGATPEMVKSQRGPGG